MFHTSAYTFASAGASVLQDMTALTDTVLSIRNNHFVVTDDFRFILAYGLGSVVTEIRANWPTLNAFGFHQIWPFDLQGTTAPKPPDRPALVDYISQPIVVPQEEELAFQISDNPATTEQDFVGVWFATPNHQWTLPAGIQRLTLKATYSFTPAAANVWSGAQTLTFETTFRGGWYVINGINVFDAAAVFARLILPHGTQYAGRVLRPGCIVQQAYGNRPDPRFMGRMGPWGQFNSIEIPYIEIVPTAGGAHTGDVRFDVTYLGDGAPLTGI